MAITAKPIDDSGFIVNNPSAKAALAATRLFVFGFGLAAAGLSTSCSSPLPSAPLGESSAALHADLIDPGSAPTQCFGMHCCPSGYGMRGVNVSQNSLLCRQVNQQHEDCFIDHPTQRQGAHACPRGTYMRGLRVDQNLLTCCYERERGFSELLTESSDSGHQEFNMHACPVPAGAGDAFMTGINVGANQFLCAGTPATPSTISSPVNINLNPEASRGFFNFFPSTSQPVWKAAVRNWLARQFNVPPNKSYLTPGPVTVTATTTVERGVVRRTVTYPSLVDGTPIPAYIFFPPGFVSTSTYRGALVVHGHFNEAKEGLGVQWDSALHAIGLYLAEQGFVTLAPDTRTWGAYKVPGETLSDGDGHNQVTNQLQSATGHFGSLPQQTVLDNLLSVSVLNGQAHLSSIAVEGLSLGADQAMWLAAVDDRIGDVILAGNFLSFACLNDPNANHSCQTVPGISTSLSSPGTNLLLDAPDIAGLIAPHRLYAMWGLNGDGQLTQTPPGSSTTCSQSAANGARAVFNALGIPNNFRYLPDQPNDPEIVGMMHEIDTTTSSQFLTGVTPFDQLDYGHQCGVGMHCCPAGKAMGGIHVGRNDFICRDVIPAQFEVCVNDPNPGTQRSGMHACPAGSYMRGVDVSGNQLTCCHDSRNTLQLRSEVVDSSTQSQGMHSCVTSQPFMTGIRADQNLLLCDGT